MSHAASEEDSSFLSPPQADETNQAYVRLPDGKGGRKPVYLGVYDSPESQAEYARIVQERSVSPVFRSADQIATGGPEITVNELFNAFLKHAEKHYRGPDGKPTGETCHIKLAGGGKPNAIAWYNAVLYGFAWDSAIQKFRESAKREPDLVRQPESTESNSN